MLTRRTLLAGAGAALATAATARLAHADPPTLDAQWIANHVETRLLGPDGNPIAGLPRWTRMQLLRGLPNGSIEVWVPRFSLIGRVPANTIGPVPIPSQAELELEKLEGPALIGHVGMPGRVVRGANIRTWPAPDQPLLRTVGHNAPLRILSSVEGDDGEEWYRADLLEGVSNLPIAIGYVHNSVVRLPRLRYLPRNPDRSERPHRHLEADLRDPALLVAWENDAPVWSTLTLKGTAANRTPQGIHRVLWRVANETMTSERIYPPIPRDAPGGYYLRNVLFTQYFTSDGASIHYNYWSSKWGYAGSHGCLGVAYNEAKFCWDWAEVGTPVYVFS
jgi:L,D-transpeptidase catalytic domain